MKPPSSQLPLDLPPKEHLDRLDFLPAPCNLEAVAWINKWPEWPGPALVLYGPPASGKTHLATIWAKKSGARIIPVDELLTQNLNDFTAKTEDVLIDQADSAIGNREKEAVIFHIYNLCKEEKRSMLLTMKKAPGALTFVIPDLASRLRAAMAVEIKDPTEEFLQNLLVKMFKDHDINIDTATLQYISPRMERSFEAARNLVEKANKVSLAEKKPVTIPLIRDVLNTQNAMAHGLD